MVFFVLYAVDTKDFFVLGDVEYWPVIALATWIVSSNFVAGFVEEKDAIGVIYSSRLRLLHFSYLLISFKLDGLGVFSLDVLFLEHW